MKYIMFTVALALVGLVAGAFIAPSFITPPKVTLPDGSTRYGCGMWVFVPMFWGGVIGLVSGGVLGVIAAHFLPAKMLVPEGGANASITDTP